MVPFCAWVRAADHLLIFFFPRKTRGSFLQGILSRAGAAVAALDLIDALISTSRTEVAVRLCADFLVWAHHNSKKREHVDARRCGLRQIYGFSQGHPRGEGPRQRAVPKQKNKKKKTTTNRPRKQKQRKTPKKKLPKKHKKLKTKQYQQPKQKTTHQQKKAQQKPCHLAGAQGP